MWDGPNTPLMSSPDGVVTWLAASGGLSALSGAGVVSDAGAPSLSSSTVRALVSTGGQTVALTGFSGGSAVTRIGSGGSHEIIFTSEATLGAMAAWPPSDGGGKPGLILGTLTPDGAVDITVIDMTGSIIEETTSVGAGLQGAISLMAVGDGRVYVRTANGLDYRLYRRKSLSLVEIAQSPEPIHGPIASGEHTYISVDRNLTGLDEGDEQTTLDTEKRVTCLGAHPLLGVYACVLPDIVRVQGAGFGQPLFELASLEAPDRVSLDPGTAYGCELDWLDFATDAGLDTGSGAREADAGPSAGAAITGTPSPSEGCSSAGRRSRGGLIVLMFGLMIGALSAAGTENRVVSGGARRTRA